MKPQLLLNTIGLFCLASIFLTVQSNGQSASGAVKQQTESSSPTPAGSPSPLPSPDNKSIISPIPLAQVVERAEESNRLVQEVSDRISQLPDPKVEEQGLRSLQESLRKEERETGRILSGPPNLNELWRQEQSWNGHNHQYLGMRRALNVRSDKLEQEIRFLETQQGYWLATLQQTEETEDLKEVFDRIRSSLEKIQSVLGRLKERQRQLVTNVNLISQLGQLIASTLQRIKQSRINYEGSLLVRDNYPLWDSRAYRENYQALAFNFGDNLLKDLVSSGHLIRLRNSWVIISTLLTIFSLVLVFNLKRQLPREPEGIDHKLKILKYPVSLALPVLLLSIITFTPNLPLGVINLLSLVLLVPILRITPLVIEPGFKHFLYSYLAFFLLDLARKLITATPFRARIILAIEVAAAIAFFAWPVYRLRQQKFSSQTFALRVVVPGIWLTISLLTISLAANILGYLALSEVVLEGTLFSIYLAIVLLTGVRAAIVVIDLLLNSPRVTWLAAVRLYKSRIQRWVGWILTAGAFLIWLVAALEFFTIRDSVMRGIEQALKRPITIGALNFSAWDILLFFLVLLSGLALAKITRFVLQEEVLARLPIRSVLPNAISTLAYYLILLVVFLMSLAAAGVEMTRFTILTGALGVGVGFGLQNIVNNFISGIILLFEHPIRLGDIVEVEGAKGEVKRIGIRSSTIMTGQGAEVIVPNADLISNRVVNWTLSHRFRRVELPVTVSYGTELPKVMSILKEATKSHPGVLTDPAPSVDFIGFGESGLLFELRFWLLQDDNFQSAKNDVADLVSKAFREAEIEIPFPQMDLRLHNLDSTPMVGKTVK